LAVRAREYTKGQARSKGKDRGVVKKKQAARWAIFGDVIGVTHRVTSVHEQVQAHGDLHDGLLLKRVLDTFPE
jgi:hypothetical protein